MINQIAKVHGRKAGRSRVAQILRGAYGRVSGLTEQQVNDAILKANLRRMPLTSAKVNEIKRHLVANQLALPARRKSNSQIGAIVSSPLAPVSDMSIRTINAQVRHETKAAGRKLTKFTRTGLTHNDAEVISSLRRVLRKNLSLSFQEVAREIKLHPTTLQRIFRRNKTDFGKLRRALYVQEIRELDRRTHNSLTNKEVAEGLRMKEGTVELYRKPGKKVGGKARIRKVTSKALFLLGGLTVPNERFIELRVLVALTGESPKIVQGALNKLIGKRLVTVIEPGGVRKYSVGPAGIRVLNATGRKVKNRAELIQSMSLEDLKGIAERLRDARFTAGAGIPSEVIKFFDRSVAKRILEREFE